MPDKTIKALLLGDIMFKKKEKNLEGIIFTFTNVLDDLIEFVQKSGDDLGRLGNQRNDIEKEMLTIEQDKRKAEKIMEQVNKLLGE